MSAPTVTGPALTVLLASGPPVSRMIVSMGTCRCYACLAVCVGCDRRARPKCANLILR
jgi:hypothetical protein